MRVRVQSIDKLQKTSKRGGNSPGSSRENSPVIGDGRARALS